MRQQGPKDSAVQHVCCHAVSPETFDLGSKRLLQFFHISGEKMRFSSKNLIYFYKYVINCNPKDVWNYKAAY